MLTPGPLPPAFSAFVRAEFRGEEVIWHGAPRAGRMFRRSALLWLFALPWTAFAMTWEGIAIAVAFTGDESGVPDGVPRALVYVFVLFGIPFVLVGLGMMAAPFWAARKAARTLQIVTDRRFALVTQGKAMTVESWPLAAVVGTKRKARRDGSGDLTLSFGDVRDSDGDRIEKIQVIHDVEDVTALDRAIAGLRGRPASP